MTQFEIFYRSPASHDTQRATTWAENEAEAIKKIIEAEHVHDHVDARDIVIMSVKRLDSAPESCMACVFRAMWPTYEPDVCGRERKIIEDLSKIPEWCPLKKVS